MVCCLYVGKCFGVVPHHMPDHVVTFSWHLRPHKFGSQTHELTCEAWHVYIRRSLRTSGGIFLGIELSSISPLYITFWFHTGREHLNICRMHF